jgi:hypothetical protein
VQGAKREAPWSCLLILIHLGVAERQREREREREMFTKAGLKVKWKSFQVRSRTVSG